MGGCVQAPVVTRKWWDPQAEAAHGCELGGVQGVDVEVRCTVPTKGPEPCLVGCAHASGWWVCVSRVGVEMGGSCVV